MMAASIGIAVFSSAAGIVLSFHVDAAPAPSIVVVLTALFVLAFLFAPKHGILNRRPA